MANLNIRDLDDTLMLELKMLALRNKTTLKELVPKILAEAISNAKRANAG